MLSTQKFTGKAAGYAKYRPSYPDEYIDYLIARNSLTADSLIADIGSGTGILTGQLLEKGLTVLAVEPNGDMRRLAEQNLGQIARFSSVDGAAENTTLEDNCLDLITVAQAFHWFDPDLFQLECRRILKIGARVSLVWNRQDYSCELVKANEEICRDLCPDFVASGNGIESKQELFERFFQNGIFEFRAFKRNIQYSLDSFIGRNLSTSYAPREADRNYSAFVLRLTELFEQYSAEDKIAIPSITHSYLGFV
jgi:SAM-dependent methyltransferase